jgi:hypothetical protein
VMPGAGHVSADEGIRHALELLAWQQFHKISKISSGSFLLKNNPRENFTKIY